MAMSLTVIVVLPETPPDVAVMMVEPTPAAVARPVALMPATAVSEEDHVTDVVISLPVPSEKVPVAVNCKVSPGATDEPAGVISMKDRVEVVSPSLMLLLPPPPHPAQHVITIAINREYAADPLIPANFIATPPYVRRVYQVALLFVP